MVTIFIHVEGGNVQEVLVHDESGQPACVVMLDHDNAKDDPQEAADQALAMDSPEYLAAESIY